MATALTDENLPVFLGPLLEKASKDMSADIGKYLETFEKEALQKAIEQTVTATLEKAQKPKEEPKEDKLDTTDPAALLKHAEKLRKAKIIEGLDLNDPDAVEAAAKLLKAEQTPSGGNHALEAQVASLQEQLTKAQNLLKASNAGTPTQETPVLGNQNIEVETLVKSLAQTIEGSRTHPGLKTS